jgi:hypothetical protein
MIPEFTASVGAPRVAGIDCPFGRPLGLPGNQTGQRAVLQAALEVLVATRGPGTVVQLPFRWPQDPREAGGEPPVPPPIVQLLKRKPGWCCGCWPTTSQISAVSKKVTPRSTAVRMSEIISCRSGRSLYPPVMLMQPSPIAETSRPLDPSLRVCISPAPVVVSGGGTRRR